MRKHWFGFTLLGPVAVAAVVAACGDSAATSRLTGGGSSGTVDTADAGDMGAAGTNTSGQGAGTGAATGLPCDVQATLENRCIGCHMGPSPAALLTYDDLMKPSSDPAKNLAQKSLERMQSTTAPMPPPPAVAPTADEIAAFQTWITGGMQKAAACTTVAPPAPANYSTPLTCTSGVTFKGGTSSVMDPGRACITCHSAQGGPGYTVAGTVYPTAHEPDNCNGIGGLSVVVTDAKGASATLTVNSAGNFSSRTAFAAPFHVKVTNGTKERAMIGALTAGDCNTCHTSTGANGAPGRVMAP